MRVRKSLSGDDKTRLPKLQKAQDAWLQALSISFVLPTCNQLNKTTRKRPKDTKSKKAQASSYKIPL